jgi:WD40 repeat protein/serine/threonine protein kinase
MNVAVMADQSQREEALFQAALQLETPEKRAAFIARECGEDHTLRQHLASLLRAHDRAGAFLDRPLSGFRIAATAAGVDPSNTPPKQVPIAVSEKPGDKIGRYKLLQRIGEGGCGVVYMAEQEEPVRRRVALKIIKVGMDTRQVIARFEAERQALAMMDHPNIARVLDAGATETGRPYFVMDLVRGIRITDYCDQSKLGTEDRLQLFMQVCHAIQHAHQKGIIHRDIKPSNILVTLHNGVPVPVIIDFGIAKATERRLTDKTLFTAFEQFIGTPAYMSPEQAEMSRLDIDTRSDIYSLGVLLYELLTGRTPFDPKALAQAGLDEMRRTIREKEPVRPSTCLSSLLQADLTTIANLRHCEPFHLISSLHGDLDWIVMKCLEKDRTRRYETANGLAVDIQRHLHNEPVLARPPSKVYRFQKMVRRNKVAFGAGLAIALVLLVGVAVSTYLFVLERAAHQRAALAERNQSHLRSEAEKAQANADDQRHIAEQNAQRMRVNAYAADVYSAYLGLQSGNLGRATDLLERQIPQRGEEDLRGFEWRYLWLQARGDELFSLAHDALVSCAIFSANGQDLATASYDGLVRIWDLGTKRVVKTLSGFEQQFGWKYLACSSNGRWLAGVRQGRISVWDWTKPDYPVRFEEPNGKARVLAFTPDSTRLVGWGDDGLVLVDTVTWQATRIPTRIRPKSFPCLAVDRSGKLAAVSHEGNHEGDHAIEVWNLESLIPAGFFRYKSEADMGFVALAWSPDGRLAATTWGGNLMLADGRTGEQLARTNAHAGSTFGVAFALDGKTLVTAGHDQLIRFWSVPDLRKLGTLRGHRDEIWSLAFSNDGRLLCTAGKDGTAKVWNPTPKEPPPELSDWYAADFTADGKSFVTLAEPSTELNLEFWDVANPAVRTTRTLPVAGLTNLVRAVLSADAKHLGVGRKDGSVEVWSIGMGKPLQIGRMLSDGLSDMAISANGRWAALGTDRGALELWDLTTGQIRSLGSAGTGRVATLRFAGGDRFLRVALEGETSEGVWDLHTGRAWPMRILSRERSAFSDDGKTLATSDTNHIVRLRDLPNLHERAALRGHRWTIYAMTFSRDGKLLATGGLDAVARIWDVETGQERTRPLRGHLQGVTGLAFSPDGKILATSSTDNNVNLWSVATGRELFSVSNASQAVFSNDGNTLLINTGQGARLLHVPTLAEIDAARQADVVEK